MTPKLNRMCYLAPMPVTNHTENKHNTAWLLSICNFPLEGASYPTLPYVNCNFPSADEHCGITALIGNLLGVKQTSKSMKQRWSMSCVSASMNAVGVAIPREIGQCQPTQGGHHPQQTATTCSSPQWSLCSQEADSAALIHMEYIIYYNSSIPWSS